MNKLSNNLSMRFRTNKLKAHINSQFAWLFSLTIIGGKYEYYHSITQKVVAEDVQKTQGSETELNI